MIDLLLERVAELHCDLLAQPRHECVHVAVIPLARSSETNIANMLTLRFRLLGLCPVQYIIGGVHGLDHPQVSRGNLQRSVVDGRAATARAAARVNHRHNAGVEQRVRRRQHARVGVESDNECRVDVVAA